ncbi:MAG: hypothetical protein H0U71_05170 [Gammaproteobacteria bacterium]|nr:hypothetical protein [Gammaproteobacteria bacterium]
MDQHSLTNLTSLLNQQIGSQETLVEYLYKAKALINVTLGRDFLDYDKVTINHYLWILSVFIEDACSLSENIRNDLLRNVQ